MIGVDKHLTQVSGGIETFAALTPFVDLVKFGETCNLMGSCTSARPHPHTSSNRHRSLLPLPVLEVSFQEQASFVSVLAARLSNVAVQAINSLHEGGTFLGTPTAAQTASHLMLFKKTLRMLSHISGQCTALSGRSALESLLGAPACS